MTAIAFCGGVLTGVAFVLVLVDFMLASDR